VETNCQITDKGDSIIMKFDLALRTFDTDLSSKPPTLHEMLAKKRLSITSVHC
jgi:hypothetical protein